MTEKIKNPIAAVLLAAWLILVLIALANGAWSTLVMNVHWVEAPGSFVAMLVGGTVCAAPAVCLLYLALTPNHDKAAALAFGQIFFGAVIGAFLLSFNQADFQKTSAFSDVPVIPVIAYLSSTVLLLGVGIAVAYFILYSRYLEPR